MKTLMLVGLTCLLAGCFASTSSYPNEYGTISLQADERGMRAFADMQNALITNGKASANRPTQAWTVRAKQEEEVTKRAFRPSFLDGLFAPKPQAKPAQVGYVDESFKNSLPQS